MEEERKRIAAKKEREERNRQDAMTLGETKEQIQKLNVRLEELRNEKQQLFLRLKKVLNRDESRKKQQQQQQKDRCDTYSSLSAIFNNQNPTQIEQHLVFFIFGLCSEMFAMQQNVPQQSGPHPQIFLPPRAPHQQHMQKVSSLIRRPKR